MRLATTLLTLLSGSAPVNTVAPAINASAVIGTQITGGDGTWSGSPTFTYQWQRNTGSFVNIGGATSKNYTPVDADFGCALRLVVTPSAGVAANSNATNLTREAPVETLGSELVLNGNFSAWTADNPDSWTVLGESGSDPMVTQVDPAGGAGTGAARMFSSATASQPRLQQTVMSVGTYYEAAIAITARTSGTLKIGDVANGLDGLATLVAVGTYRAMGRALSTSFQLQGIGSAPHNFVIDNATVKAITLNVQLVAPSADMRITQFYTLPGSPVNNTRIWVMPRVSDFANGNYWLALLEYTGTQWNITLYSVASHTRTSRATATGIGTTNGLRVNMNGTAITLETTADGGSNWTQRGVTVTNATYQTATGVNSLWTSDITPGNMVYEAAV